MEFNKINNEEFYNQELYSLNLTMSFKRAPIYTSQINHISLAMPSTPVLYQWDKIPKVNYSIYLVEIIKFFKIESK
jgi:hypothetical protein